MTWHSINLFLSKFAYWNSTMSDDDSVTKSKYHKLILVLF